MDAVTATRALNDWHESFVLKARKNEPPTSNDLAWVKWLVINQLETWKNLTSPHP